MNLADHLATYITNSGKTCPNCNAGAGELYAVLRDQTSNAKGHYADIRCPNCDGRHIGFLPWPERPTEKRAALQKNLAKRVREAKGIDRCELCRRDEIELPKYGLEAHHLDGNRDNNRTENVLIVCVHCHRLIHHVQTYFGHYHQVDEEVEHAPS